MKNNSFPKSIPGKWSVGLNAFFLGSLAISIFLVKALKILSFDNHWWDVTVPIIFGASLIALITGIFAAVKRKDRASLVFLSIFIGICMILFIIFHSLFIND